MYTHHFELREAPFSLTPDPRFVYLSERHREALAHLLFGLEEGGGFVQLTGEVGTGKTTICRTLLRQLQEGVDVALIFNPVLTVVELLQAILRELHVEPPAKATSAKALTDALYEHLLEANAGGRRSILIIDEAQKLSPLVLEQIRLLTNLETDQSKLLQVFLIGQPELRAVLQDRGLRQLAQRVTARYHLEPLDRAETGEYIRHRLRVAGHAGSLFTRPAVRTVHRLTGGVPRLVNVLCDRTLLGAYASERRVVDARLVRRAQAEIEGRARGGRRAASLAAAATASVAALALAGAIVAIDEGRALRSLAAVGWLAAAPNRPEPDGREAEPPRPAPAPARPATVPQRARAGPGPAPGTPAAEPEPPSLRAALQGLSGADSAAAIERLLGHWNLAHAGAEGELCAWASARGFACRAGTATWEDLRRFDLPALLALNVAGGDAVHVVLESLAGTQGTLFAGGRTRAFDLAELDPFWRGDYLLLWRMPVKDLGVIKGGDRGAAVAWLKARLAEVDGIEAAGPADVADESLVERVERFQRSRGILVDGVVGPETLINLAAAAPGPDRPSLARPRRDQAQAYHDLARGDP